MLTFIVWWATIVLELAILLRALKTGALREFPFFCIYLGCVLLSSASGYVVFRMRPLQYQYWYWTWEFVCVIAGYNVVLGVVERGLVSHDGARKAFRNVALWFFGAIVGYVAIHSMLLRHSNALISSVEVERDLRTAEALLLAAVMGVVAYYGIAIGRSLKGIVVGYGLCVATIVITHSMRSFLGAWFQDYFSAIRSWSYLLSLLIWTYALWSYQPSPAPKRLGDSGPDYDALAMTTKEAVETVREQLGKAARQ
jgi:hypothetical protein